MNKKRVLIYAIVLIIFGLVLWGVSLLPPILIDKPDTVEPCIHETWNPEIDGGLIQLYIPVISLVAGQVPNQAMKVAYCIECGVLSTYPDEVYYYSELWNEVINDISSN